MSDDSNLELPATPTSTHRLQNPHATRIQTRSVTRAAALIMPLTPPRTIYRYHSNARRYTKRALSETPSINLSMASETLKDEDNTVFALVGEALTACEAILTVGHVRFSFLSACLCFA